MSCHYCRPRIAKKKITQLSAATEAALSDLFEVVQYDAISGEYTNKKITFQAFVDRLSTIFITNATNGSNNIHGDGSPVGVVTPDAIDQFYRDETTPGLWQSTGLTNTDWIPWVEGG